MQQVDIDFEVFKALTARRRSESHTYNEVIRELLDIDGGSPVHAAAPIVQAMSSLANSFPILKEGPTTGIKLRGLFLPNGTLLRATHKGTGFDAKIIDGKWVNGDGAVYDSPSAAASAITQNNVNGWRFWQAKRPSDSDWRNLDMLPKV
jgi:hypothetical protein